MKKHPLLYLITGLSMVLLSCSEGEDLPLLQDSQPIINGAPDTNPAHNAIVGIYMNDSTSLCGGQYLFCTGTLIHPRWILTAAHCITTGDTPEKLDPCSKNIKIGFGTTEQEVASSLHSIKNFYFHKQYGKYKADSTYSTYNNDIALLELESEIPSSVASPILPHPPWLPISFDNLPANFEFVGFGYDENGVPGKKLTFTGPVTDYCGLFNGSDDAEGCRKSFVIINGCHPNPRICSEDGPYNNKKDYVLMPYGSFYNNQMTGGTCNGDSGGPALYTIDQKQYISGVTSYGDEICKVYGVSTSIQDFYPWIISIAPEVADQFKEICNNKIDDNQNNATDCDDVQCRDSAECKPNTPDTKTNSDDKKSSKSGCAINSNKTTPPLALLIFMLLAFVRRFGKNDSH